MRPSPSWFHLSEYRLLSGFLSLFGAMLTGGCATTALPPAPPAATVAAVPEPPPDFVPVVRYGRYTLVERVPEPAQYDLMQQVVEISIPPALDTNVGDALRHVLLRSGYRLCDATDAAALYAFPLPAAHLRFGPLTLRETLQTLAGPAWDLSVDDGNRQVCFKPHASPVAASLPAPAPASAEAADQADTAEDGEVQP